MREQSTIGLVYYSLLPFQALYLSFFHIYCVLFLVHQASVECHLKSAMGVSFRGRGRSADYAPSGGKDALNQGTHYDVQEMQLMWVLWTAGQLSSQNLNTKDSCYPFGNMAADLNKEQDPGVQS